MRKLGGRRRPMKISVTALVSFVLSMPLLGEANPYLAKPSEPPATTRVAACAITGGFIHLYAALDYGLFGKKGLKNGIVSIPRRGVSLAAVAPHGIHILFFGPQCTL